MQTQSQDWPATTRNQGRHQSRHQQEDDDYHYSSVPSSLSLSLHIQYTFMAEYWIVGYCCLVLQFRFQEDMEHGMPKNLDVWYENWWFSFFQPQQTDQVLCISSNPGDENTMTGRLATLHGKLSDWQLAGQARPAMFGEEHSACLNSSSHPTCLLASRLCLIGPELPGEIWDLSQNNIARPVYSLNISISK